MQNKQIPLQLNNKKTTQFKNEQKTLKDTSSKIYRWQVST